MKFGEVNLMQVTHMSHDQANELAKLVLSWCQQQGIFNAEDCPGAIEVLDKQVGETYRFNIEVTSGSRVPTYTNLLVNAKGLRIFWDAES